MRCVPCPPVTLTTSLLMSYIRVYFLVFRQVYAARVAMGLRLAGKISQKIPVEEVNPVTIISRFIYQGHKFDRDLAVGSNR